MEDGKGEIVKVNLDLLKMQVKSDEMCSENTRKYEGSVFHMVPSKDVTFQKSRHFPLKPCDDGRKRVLELDD